MFCDYISLYHPQNIFEILQKNQITTEFGKLNIFYN
jgi:hypothetical protein